MTEETKGNQDNTNSLQHSARLILNTLSFFNLTYATLNLVLIGLMFSKTSRELFRISGTPVTVNLLDTMPSMLLAFASAIGIWGKKKWGWWLVSIYYLYSLYLEFVLRFSGLDISLPREMQFGMIIRFGFWVPYIVIILAFLLLARTRSIFGLTTENRRSILIYWSITLIIIIMIDQLVKQFLL